MPKMKNKRSALKRFKLTGSGKIKFKRSGLRHNLGSKNSESKRKKGIVAYIHHADANTVMKCMPYRQ